MFRFGLMVRAVRLSSRPSDNAILCNREYGSIAAKGKQNAGLTASSLVIEGIDGAGKSSIARQLYDALSQTHRERVVLTLRAARFVGGWQAIYPQSHWRKKRKARFRDSTLGSGIRA